MRLVGTELKFNLYMAPMGDVHIWDCEFEIMAMTMFAGRGYVIRKEECVKVDDDNVIVMVDTAKTGAGTVKLKVTVDLPDADFDDLRRKEVVLIDTGTVVNK